MQAVAARQDHLRRLKRRINCSKRHHRNHSSFETNHSLFVLTGVGRWAEVRFAPRLSPTLLDKRGFGVLALSFEHIE
jgi:hypothetical protein